MFVNDRSYFSECLFFLPEMVAKKFKQDISTNFQHFFCFNGTFPKSQITSRCVRFKVVEFEFDQKSWRANEKKFCHHLLSTSFSVPVDPRILNRAWAYSSSRCFKLFVVDELFVTPDPLDSPLPSMPASFGPPCDDKLLGVLKQKRGHSQHQFFP